MTIHCPGQLKLQMLLLTLIFCQYCPRKFFCQRCCQHKHQTKEHHWIERCVMLDWKEDDNAGSIIIIHHHGCWPTSQCPTEHLCKCYACSEPFPCQCLLKRKVEAINCLDNIDIKKTTMNKFISFLVAILVAAQSSAFMDQPVFCQQQVMSNLILVMFEF